MIDDSLSALDNEVGSHVFYKGFKKRLHGKTRILVTHAVHLLEKVDRVVLMKEGRIVACLPYPQIRHLPEYINYIKAGAKKKIKKRNWLRGYEELEEEKTKIELLYKAPKKDNSQIKILEIEQRLNSRTKKSSKKELVKQGSIIMKEEKKSGIIGLNIILSYLKYYGIFPFILTLLLIMTFTLSIFSIEIWIINWSKN